MEVLHDLGALGSLPGPVTSTAPSAVAHDHPLALVTSSAPLGSRRRFRTFAVPSLSPSCQSAMKAGKPSKAPKPAPKKKMTKKGM